ncbi:hypothetical protein ES703_84895 [subsurface metagenome]
MPPTARKVAQLLNEIDSVLNQDLMPELIRQEDDAAVLRATARKVARLLNEMDSVLCQVLLPELVREESGAAAPRATMPAAPGKEIPEKP